MSYNQYPGHDVRVTIRYAVHDGPARCCLRWAEARAEARPRSKVSRNIVSIKGVKRTRTEEYFFSDFIVRVCSGEHCDVRLGTDNRSESSRAKREKPGGRVHNYNMGRKLNLERVSTARLHAVPARYIADDALSHNLLPRSARAMASWHQRQPSGSVATHVPVTCDCPQGWRARAATTAHCG